MRGVNEPAARIPGNNFAPAIFLVELEIQCNLINKGSEKLEKAAAYWQALNSGIEINDGKCSAPIDIVATCSVILSAVASIRRVLFLSNRSGKKHDLIEKRCVMLMELLGTPDLPIMNSAAVRNAWEHMDERLDGLLVNWEGGSISPIHVAAEPPEGTIALRRFDPVNFSIHYADLEIRLRPCIEEARLLSERISMAFTRLPNERFDIYDKTI